MVISGSFLAYHEYKSFEPLKPPSNDLETAITYTAFNLIDLAVKLGFLGVILWAGISLSKHGIDAVVKIESGEKTCSGQQNMQSQ